MKSPLKHIKLIVLLMAFTMMLFPVSLIGETPDPAVIEHAKKVQELRDLLKNADKNREVALKEALNNGAASQALLANINLPQTRLSEVLDNIRKYGIEKVAGPGFTNADMEVTALTLILVGTDGDGYLDEVDRTNTPQQIEILGDKMRQFANDRKIQRDAKKENLQVVYGTYGYTPNRNFYRTWEKEKAQIQRDLGSELLPEAEAEMRGAYNQFKSSADAVETVEKARNKLAAKFGDCVNCQTEKK